MVLRKFCKWKWSCENFASGKGVAKILHLDLAGTNISHFDLAGAKILHLNLAGAKFSHLTLAIAKFIFSLVQLSSNGHNFFISAPICTLF